MRLHSPPVPALGLILALLPGPALGATFEVTNLSDSGPGSLRQAVLDANAAPGADEVAFQAGLAGTIVLTAGEIVITGDLVVQGPGADALTVSGNGDSRIFRIDGASGSIAVTISGLRLTEGNSLYFGGAILAGGDSVTILDSVIADSSAMGLSINTGRGGGICGFGTTLRIERTTLMGNRVSWGSLSSRPSMGANLFLQDGALTLVDGTVVGGSGDVGSGIRLEGGTHTLLRSTISGNRSEFRVGAGLAVEGGAVVDIVESTVSGNQGSSVYISDWFSEGSTVRVLNSTFSGNTDALRGGAVDLVGGTLDLRLTTVSGNSGTDGSLSVYNDSVLNLDHAIVANGTPRDLFRESGTINAVWSLIENPGDAVNGTNLNNRFGIDPNLGPLADNGGPTLTHALVPGSPALDAGDPAIPSPPPTDQRGPGFVRLFNSRIDLGSFERQTADGAVEIPVLGSLGMAALMALLAGLALWTIRRS